MRTPTLRKYESKLVEVNDQLCYFLFSDSEVVTHLSNSIKDSDSRFTTEAFPDNKFSERLHIKVEALPLFREKAFHTLVGMSLITAVEYILNYIEEIEKYHSYVAPCDHDSIKDNKPEEQLKKKIKGWLGTGPEIAIIKTIRYLRLRRNHIAHVRDEMSQEFSSLLKNDSNLLNSYWMAKPSELYDFNFSKEEYSSFSVNEVFSLVNLTRICMREVDKIVVSTLSIEDIAQYEISEFLKNDDIKRLKISSKIRKFRAFIKHKYGTPLQCSEEEYTAYVSNAYSS